MAEALDAYSNLQIIALGDMMPDYCFRVRYYFIMLWQSFFLHKCSIRSIVCLNLPSFSGGLNPWGTPSKRKQRKVSSRHSLYKTYFIPELSTKQNCLGEYHIWFSHVFYTIAERLGNASACGWWPSRDCGFQRCLAWACLAISKRAWNSSCTGLQLQTGSLVAVFLPSKPTCIDISH